MAICACGCGGVTNGRFCQGHHMRTRPVVSGYRKAHNTGSIKFLHQQRAECAFGHQLPSRAVVHHADGTRSESSPLVICEDAAYHRLLHVRMRVRAAGGDPNTDRICYTCKHVKSISDFTPADRSRKSWYCRDCRNARNRARRIRLKAVA